MTDAQRIAEAVNDPNWQEFRLGLKGRVTGVKLRMLESYFSNETRTAAEEWLAYENTPEVQTKFDRALEDIRIRCDNYIKALVRGGFLDTGMDLDSVINSGWSPTIKKN